jgi:hypothetical protein
MLTSTYTLVALSVEQTAVRAALHSLAEALRALPDPLAVAAPLAAGLCMRMREVHHSCHWRKLDKFLLPALRRGDSAIDALLRDLDALSSTAAEAIGVAEACVVGRERVDAKPFRHAIERAIGALRRRLEREEDELFPLARSVVGGEAWFAIANQMLAHDAHVRERRGEPSPGPLQRRANGLDAYPLSTDPGRRHTGLSIAH